MIGDERIELPLQAAAEAKAFLRVPHDGEDALVAALLRSAAELCERFTGRVLIARAVNETLAPARRWQKLGRFPVRAITAVEAVTADGPVALVTDAYAIDIDANGSGWLRVTEPGDARPVRITYTAGTAASWEELPEALRHGIVRLAAHLYTRRDGGEDAPPAAVTALWRPWRQLRMR